MTRICEQLRRRMTAGGYRRDLLSALGFVYRAGRGHVDKIKRLTVQPGNDWYQITITGHEHGIVVAPHSNVC